MLSQVLINNRAYQLFSDLQNELTLKEDKNYLFELPYLCCLNVEGEKAIDFLQGQVTGDVSKITQEKIKSTALCNLKGRVLALLEVLDWQGIKLILPNDLSEVTASSLNKIAPLSRVKIEETNEYKMYGFYLNNDKDLLPFNKDILNTSDNDFFCYALSPKLYLILVKKDKETLLKASFIQKEQMRGSLAWHYLRLVAKSFEIYPDTRGLFLPHRLHLHLNDFISFNKGCYKGQEIIARTHYRATLKHGLEFFNLTIEKPLVAGKKIFALDKSTEIGEIVDYCPTGDNEYLVAAIMLLERPDDFIIEEP
ncbi:MAG: folate-binding protein YgfZ [Proteobacteria bacterium]|nr:folate-binding protein YgfZ [Pseudomonadota bacterium]